MGYVYDVLIARSFCSPPKDGVSCWGFSSPRLVTRRQCPRANENRISNELSHRVAIAAQVYDGQLDLENLIGHASTLAKPPVKQRIYAFDLLAREFYNAEGNLTLQEDIYNRTARSAEHFG